MKQLIGKAIRYLAVALALLALPLAPVQKAQESIPFETLLLGASAGFPRNVNDGTEIQVITNENKWRKVWKRTHPFSTPIPPLPEVDFSTHMIIAVYYKYLPDASFTMTITELTKREDHLEIAVKETGRRGQGCPAVPAVIIFPMQIIETDFLEKRFRKNIQVVTHTEIVDCAP